MQNSHSNVWNWFIPHFSSVKLYQFFTLISERFAHFCGKTFRTSLIVDIVNLTEAANGPSKLLEQIFIRVL